MFGFVAYQLWGTGIETARAQRALESEFEDLLAASPPPPAVTDSADGQPTSDPVVSTEPDGDGSTVVIDDGTDSAIDTSDSDSTAASGDVDASADGSFDVDISGDTTTATPVAIPVEQQVIPPIEEGDAVARIDVPAIGVNDIVVAGVTRDDLKRGPGHFPETPLPGQLGNVAIAGHRTTYGQPFPNDDNLNPGDDIIDTGCSLKVFRRECLAGIKLYRGLHRFLPTLLRMEGYRVVQVAVGHRPRQRGRSKYGVRNRVFSAFTDLLAVRWMKSRSLRYGVRE